VSENLNQIKGDVFITCLSPRYRESKMTETAKFMNSPTLLEKNLFLLNFNFQQIFTFFKFFTEYSKIILKIQNKILSI
jgi:hypothetical protein